MNCDTERQLRDLSIEDIIWIIYFFLAIASLISNFFERNSLLKTNRRANKTSKKINIIIFFITFFIYLYFAYFNWKEIERLKKGPPNNDILLNQARLIAALLFLVGGAIYLATEFEGVESSEIGFI